MANEIKGGVMVGAGKLWVGIGALVLVGAGAVVPAASAQTAPAAGHGGHAAPAATPRAGGQGGERGEAAETSALTGASADVAYATRLMLVRGHLTVGMELVHAGAWDEAVVHFLHPAEEIYSDLRPELRRRRAPDLKAGLDGLATRVRAKRGGPGLETAHRELVAAVDRAWMAGRPAGARDRPGFVADVAARTLRSAASEYAEALEDGRFANVVEYQDGHGFVTETDALLRRHEGVLAATGADAWHQVRTAFTELRRAWPAPRPPEAPVLSVGEVAALVSRIELAAQSWR